MAQRLEILTQEVMDYEYTLSPKGNIIYGAPAGKYDDCVISLSLAVWGIRNQLREAQVVQEAVMEDAQDRQGRGKPHNLDRERETMYSGY